jgi:hypothetical protein
MVRTGDLLGRTSAYLVVVIPGWSQGNSRFRARLCEPPRNDATRHCEERSDEATHGPSFRGDAKHRARNLEIPRCAIAHLRSAPSDHPGMTKVGLLPRECAADDRLRDEAIHSSFARRNGLLRFARNDVAQISNTTPRSRGARRPRFCKNRSRLDKQRAQGKPGAQCTRSLACEINRAHERSHHRFTGNRPAFPAQWFYGLLRALPGDQALLPPSPARLLADLTPALGRQNDTTWPYASASFVRLAIARLTLPRPPHPAPNVRDDREAPLLWARDGGSPSADLPDR